MSYFRSTDRVVHIANLRESQFQFFMKEVNKRNKILAPDCKPTAPNSIKKKVGNIKYSTESPQQYAT